MNNPICLYCKKEMSSRDDSRYIGAFERPAFWYECRTGCGARSPVRLTKEKAYNAAMPNKILTWEEVVTWDEEEDPTPIYIEGLEPFYASGWAIFLDKEIHLKGEYNRTWRAWIRKPTEGDIADQDC